MNIGDILDGKYEVIKILGQGGMSIVYLCRNNRLGNLWAIKEIKSELKSKVDFLAEPNILKNLNHNGIPRIIDIFYQYNNLYMVEDYIEGQTLEEFIKKNGSFDSIKTCEIALKLCDILLYLHGFDPPIIYRDLKPSNIMITNKNEVKLIDFGISRIYKENKSSDTIFMGTMGYAAPEQYGLSQSDARTDIYGLGSTMYFMLMGKAPEGFIKPLEDKKCSNLNDALKKIIQKSMEIEKSNRYSSVLTMKNEIAEFIYLHSGTRKLNLNDYKEKELTKTLLINRSKEKNRSDTKFFSDSNNIGQNEDTQYSDTASDDSNSTRSYTRTEGTRIVDKDIKNDKTRIAAENTKTKKKNKKGLTIVILSIIAFITLFSLARLKSNGVEAVNNTDSKAKVTNISENEKDAQNNTKTQTKPENVVKDTSIVGYIDKNSPMVISQSNNNNVQNVKSNGKAKGKNKNKKSNKKESNSYDIVYEIKPAAVETKFNGKFIMSFDFIELKNDEIIVYLIVQNKTGSQIELNIKDTKLISDSGKYFSADGDKEPVIISNSTNTQKIQISFKKFNLDTNKIILDIWLKSSNGIGNQENIRMNVNIK